VIFNTRNAPVALAGGQSATALAAVVKLLLGLVRTLAHVSPRGDLGSAGGHRSMAKAVVKLRDWRARVGECTADAVRAAIVSRVSRALR